MTVGVVVYGDAGNVQIDDTYANLALYAKGTGAMADAPYFTRAGEFVVTSTGEFPVIAWRSAFPITLLYVEKAGDTWKFHLVSNDAYIGNSFTYYIFGRPTSSGNFGFQVFDSGGKLTFDSGRKYMKVKGVGSHDIGPAGTVDSYPSGTYATAISQGAMAVLVGGAGDPSQGYFWTASVALLAAYPTPTGYSYESSQLSSSSGHSPTLPTFPSSTHGKVMLIDVAGL